MEEEATFRTLSGPSRLIWNGLTLIIPILSIIVILNVPTSLGFLFYTEQFTGLFFGMMFAMCFMGVPAGRGAPRDRIPVYDWVLAALGLASGLYIATYFPDISATLGWVTTDRVVAGSVFVLVALESLRRVTGLLLVCIVAAFLAYAFVAPYMPGALRGSRTDFQDLINYLYLDGNNGLGLIRIAATIGMAFILFGQVLSRFKGSDLINDLVVSIFGRYRGGPAKASVVGSSLVGTVTGGAATNVMLTGVVTIPLMKRSGYSAEYAGAVESVSSSGGQIMPPVMGIAAFLIADNLGIPYAEVVLAATVPALLYYIGLFAQIDLGAARRNVTGLPRAQMPKFRTALVKSWPIFPIFGTLIYLIMGLGYEPATAGIYGSTAALFFLLFNRNSWKGLWGRIVGSLMDTSRAILSITVVLAAAGLIVGVVNITGLGFNMALALSQLGEYSLFVLLVASAVVCIVLGMGMPTVAAYTLVAILIAPAMVELGVLPLSAHLFILFFAVVSNFTPPVAIACFAAAIVARVDAMRIASIAVRLGFAAYIVPFLFVYSPTLILKGDTVDVVLSVVSAIVGMVFLAAAFESYLFHRLDRVLRMLSGAAGLVMLMPVVEAHHILLIVNASGAALGVTVALISWARRTQARFEPIENTETL